ncbi:MAG TPA: energy-coupling factor transporter transmembrane protein EcfT [Firmicutes bacterium]|nr:energy-coupling factor transporter transmembrane protein EcfT [Bacillota bacterium]
MIKDITIGQYFPGKSVLHRTDPRMKLILTVFYIVLLFLIQNILGYIIAIGFLVVAYIIAKIPFKMVLKSIKPIIPIIIFTAILNMFFIEGESEPLFEWWIFRIAPEGVKLAVTMAIRVVCLIVGASLLTYTTLPISLTDAIEDLLGPLKKLKFPVHELAMMMSIALRFIPTLVEETDKIMAAQKARGADLESGNLMQRAKALVPILIPLFISAFRRAEELALAMEARCYHGGENRTRLKQLHYTKLDVFAFLLFVLMLVGIILLNLYAPVLI